MVTHKEIRLYPSVWYLDLYIIDSREDKEELAKLFKKNYGEKKKYYMEHMCFDCVSAVNAKENSKYKGRTRIVMILLGRELAVLVHEIQHILYRYSEYSGVNLNKKSQEWQALMAEYIFYEATKDDFDKWVLLKNKPFSDIES